MTIRAIIDCDPGQDDVMAILLAGKTMDVRGITTVHGNAPLLDTTRNARQVVEFAGLTHIPIAQGLGRPLVRDAFHAPGVHGVTGLDGPTLEPPTVALHPSHAVDFLIDASHTIDDLYLLPIGPLTNIAAALVRDQSLPQRIKQICLMGGSLTFGNSTPAAEFNIFCDPEAAHVVFTSGIPIKMVGINVTHQVIASPTYRDAIRKMPSQTAKHVWDMLEFYSAAESAKTGLDGGSMHDPLAVAALLDPEILTFEPMHVAVELVGTHTAGMTLCDGRHLGPDMRALKPRRRGADANAEVAVAVNAKRFWDLFLDVLATYP